MNNKEFEKEVAKIGGYIEASSMRRVIWELGSMDERGRKLPTTIEDLNTTFAKGEIKFIYRTWCGEEIKPIKWGRTFINPTWRDVIAVFGDLLRESDDHHSFLEAIDRIASNLYEFQAGN